MMRFRNVLAGLVVSVLVVGCSGSSASYSSVDQLAAALDRGGAACTGVATLEPSQLASRRAECQIDRSTVGLYLFRSEADRDEWLTVATDFGVVVVGSKWAITTTDRAQAERIARAVGGDIRS